ncbi:MAG: DNA (cytosine-5-)-methyltransferase [Robiginitomaculum sp.]|nr:DNA (cytosine-5-)-methyltransferase [Robiginitomaculum sp.]
MRTLELFSGAGGLALGLKQAGFDHVQLVELNKHACNTLRKNFNPDTVFEGDIKDFDFSSISNIDFVAGGPPCQPFSLAGKHKADLDNRDMFPYAVKAIKELRPKGFLFENVKGLLRKSFSDYFEYILLRLKYPTKTYNTDQWKEDLKRLRKIDMNPQIPVEYDVKFKLLNTADYGVPQKRERVIIVGTRSDLNCSWKFPLPTHSKNILQIHQQNGEYWATHDLTNINDLPEREKQHTQTSQLKLFPHFIKPWQTVRDCLKEQPHPNELHKINGHEFRDGARIYAGHTGSYIDEPAKTLKAGVHGVPGGENMIRYADGTVRYFTVFEGKLLQTFPHDYEITGAWTEGMRQIGNAVPVLLAKILGVSIYSAITGNMGIEGDMLKSFTQYT